MSSSDLKRFNVDNLALWNSVAETDPKYTKKVTFGRGFTAIDPMYQVKKATKAFGVAGEGWGWDIVETLFLPTDNVAVRVRVWQGERGNYIEHWGQCDLYVDTQKSKADKECMKKATTDGITKGLSYFGISADVFLGMFDDNKYVQEMQEKHAQQKSKECREFIKNATEELLACQDIKELALLSSKHLSNATYNECSDAQKKYYTDMYNKNDARIKSANHEGE